MKINYEFTMPDDQHDFDMCVRSGAYYDTITEVVQRVRSWNKHGHNFKNAEEALDAVWDLIFETCEVPVPGWSD